MTDMHERASDREQMDRDLAIEAARNTRPEAPITGHCLWCNESLTGGRRWCEGDGCKEDWELAQEAQKRHRGRR